MSTLFPTLYRSWHKTAIVRDPKKTSLTIKGLKSKKTYYFRISTYKRLNGKRHWSPWSDYMKVKTK